MKKNVAHLWKFSVGGGGGGSRPIHKVWGNFFAPNAMEFLVKKRGGGQDPISIRFGEFF